MATCSVTELAVNEFLEANEYVRWNEKNGEYRVPKGKRQVTQTAIDELTLASRKYGVTNPGSMFYIQSVPYNLTPGRTKRVDNMLDKGITHYQVLVENMEFTSEFQQKYDEQRRLNKVQEGQLKIDFDNQLKENISEVYDTSPEFLEIGTREDYMTFLKEKGKENDLDYQDSDQAFEDFYKYMDNRHRLEVAARDDERYFANRQYTNTRNQEGTKSTTEETRKNVTGTTRYIAQKRELLENLKNNLSRFQTLNKGNEHKDSYIQKVNEFHDVINQVMEEVGQLTSTDARTVFHDVLQEIEALDHILDNIDTFKVENHQILDRLNTITNLLLGQNIDGQTVEGEKVMLDGTSTEGFNDIVVTAKDLQNKYNDFLYRVAKDAFENDPIWIQQKDKFTPQEANDFLNSILEKGEDIGLTTAWTLGINSHKDSIITKVLNDLFQMNVRKVEQSVLERETRLEQLANRLYKMKFDRDKFFGKDINGVKTGRLISKFTNKWLVALNSRLDKIKAFDAANNTMKQSKYNEFIAWNEENAVIIDIRKIERFKNLFSDIYGEHFNFTDEQMANYEAGLRDILGKTFDDIIGEQMDNLQKFMNYEQSQLDKDTMWTNKNNTAVNPFLFLDNYFSENRRKPLSTTVEGAEASVFNLGRYNSIIPLRNIMDSVNNVYDSGFYDAVFERDIETNETAYEAQKVMQSLLSEHINPAYSIAGKNISAIQIPMLRKAFAEAYADSSKRGFLPMIRTSVKHAIDTLKDRWFDPSFDSNRKGIVSNYSDASLREIKTYKSALYLKSDESLRIMADKLGLSFPLDVKKNQIIDAIARAEVLPKYSTDIFQNIIAVSSQASLHRARQDTAFIGEMLYKQYIAGDGAHRHMANKKFRSWIDTVIYGKRNQKKSDDNTFISQMKIKRLSDADKSLKAIFKEVSDGDIGDNINFKVEDIKYFQRPIEGTNLKEYVKIDLVESEVDGEIVVTETEVQITKAEFAKKLDAYLKMRTDNLGINMDFSSFVSGVLRNISMSFLGYNPKAGFKNLMEGKLVNMATDAEGVKWTRGNNRHSSRILAGANIMRFSEGKLDFVMKKKADQLKTIDLLVRRLGVLQDRRDFRDKKNQVSAYNTMNDILDPFTPAVAFPEYHNQIENMLSVLQDHIIMNYKGERIGFVNGDGLVREGGKYDADGNRLEGKVLETGNNMVAYIPGTLTLRDEYRYTAEAFNEDGTLKEGNLNQYINKDNIGFETFEVFDIVEGKAESSNAIHFLNLKIQDTINKTQGNYSSMDSQIVMGNTWGRFLMAFKRHAPELINQRFGKTGNDIIQGRANAEGRYRALFRNPGALGIAASGLALVNFGPLIAGIVLGTGALYYVQQKIANTYFSKDNILDLTGNMLSSAAMLQEILIRTANMPLALMNSKFQLEDIVTKNTFLEKLETSEKLNQDEIGAIRATASEIAMSLSGILFMMMAKSALGANDDDDDDPEKKQIRNFIDNYGNQILGSLTTFMDPKNIYEDNVGILLMAPINNTIKLGNMIRKYHTQGKGTKMDIVYQLLKTQPLVPISTTILKPIKEGGIGRMWKDEDEYMTGQWHDDILKSPEMKLKTRIRNQRINLKDEYIQLLNKRYQEELGYDKYRAEQAAEKYATKLLKSKETTRYPGETFKELDERTDFKQINKDAKEYIADVELEEDDMDED